MKFALETHFERLWKKKKLGARTTLSSHLSFAAGWKSAFTGTLKSISRHFCLYTKQLRLSLSQLESKPNLNFFFIAHFFSNSLSPLLRKTTPSLHFRFLSQFDLKFSFEWRGKNKFEHSSPLNVIMQINLSSLLEMQVLLPPTLISSPFDLALGSRFWHPEYFLDQARSPIRPAFHTYFRSNLIS